jgi:predicted 2-oxoglutarate/Fe(II)-dependent dioxygenase YbiX
MSLHCDHISNLFDGVKKGIPTMSALGLLNNDYEGGEFIMWDRKIEFNAGDLMIFPSNFLYPHKVDPITKGERYSFVSWSW